MATDVEPPILRGPSAKERRYDRQLRLWAANGQQALEEAHVLLLNASTGVAGVETLKNLVLPGIGSFTIVDEQVVKEEDLGINFFLEQDSLGRSRAVETTRLLRELNPEVRGIATSQSPETWLANSDISSYALILVIGPTQLNTVLRKVSEKAQKHDVPIIYIETMGFFSRFSIQLPDIFPIVETHPDPESTQDLRLVKPWPDLLDHMRSKTEDLDNLSDHEHGHVPWLLLLLHYLDRWHTKHGVYPTTYKEKTAFRGEVAAAARKDNAEGGEENFDEAVASVLKSLNSPSISSGLKEIFAEHECSHPSSASSNFWIIAHAIQRFTQKDGVLPLPGPIPDMKSQSSDYIALQKLYRAKAQADLAAVTITVRKLEEDFNRTPMDSREIEQFCKLAAFVRLARGRKIAVPAVQDKEGKVHIDWAGRAAVVVRELGDPASSMATYIALSAFDCGLDAAGVTEDPAATLALCKDGIAPTAIHAAGQAMLHDLKVHDPELDKEAAAEMVEKMLTELSRSGPAELHNTASLTGGLVAQEAIKIITKQYIPADNTVIWDGIASRVATYRL